MLAPRDADAVDLFLRSDNRLHHQEIRRSRAGGAHTVTHTFIIGGEVFSGLYIPPMYVGINEDGSTPELKTVIHGGFFARVDTSLDIDWELNGSSFFPPSGTPYPLSDGDKIQPIIASGTGADASIWVTIKIEPQ